MVRSELIRKMQEKCGLTLKQTEEALNAFLKTVEEALKSGESVVLTGFGSFVVRQRKARSGINPKTGEKISIPATVSPAFKVGKGLKVSVSGNKSSGKK